MGLLDMLFGGDGQPQQNNLPIDELRQLGLSDGLINYYQQEQAKAQKAQMWNNAINGVANIASGAQGMGARFGGGGDGGGGSSGPGANTPLSLDGLVDRALKFSQIREGISKQKQAAEARAAIPALAARLGVPADVVAAMDPSDLSAMYKQMQDADLKAKASIRQEDAAFDAAGITDPAQRQAIRARQYEVKPELTNIKTENGEVSVFRKPDSASPTGFQLFTPDGKPFTGTQPKPELSTIKTENGEVSVFRKPNPQSATGFDLITADGKPYETPQPKWKMETIKTAGGDFTVAVRPNPQAPSGFDVIDAVSGKPIDLAALQQQSIAAAAEKKAAESTATNIADKQAGLGRTLNSIDEFATNIDAVLNDPSINNYVGSAWGQLSSNIAGTDAANAAAKVNQLKARAFLIGAQSLKGQGSLTEAEGAKVEAAVARLDPKQSPEQFRAALMEIAASLKNMRLVAMQEAGGQLQSRPQAAPSSPAPTGSDWQTLGSAGRIRRVN